MIIGIDPGLDGYLVRLQGPMIDFMPMPTTPRPAQEISYWLFKRALRKWAGNESPAVFLERVHPWAMSTKSAFGFGRGIATLECAIMELGFSLTLVEPSKWMKWAHQGVRGDLKPKAKSLVAMKRLYPHILPTVPPTNSKNKKPHDGAVDAFFIAQWGKRQQNALEDF